MSKSPSRKKYGFFYYSNEKCFDEIVDLGYRKSFYLLTSEILPQMTIFEEGVEFDNKYFSPLRVSLHDWRKKQIIVKKRTRKKN